MEWFDSDSILNALVACLTPNRPRLEKSTRETLQRDVFRYVKVQVGRMPVHLRVPFKTALMGFNTLPLLRHGRPFVALDPQHRAEYVGEWAFSSMGLKRDLIRLVRSFVLLRFMDDPRILSVLEQTNQEARIEG